ncbi:DNA polymerase III subunit beta [Trichocoleus sp. FACHB-262]|uniref:DNA polymerase III subunit beta n=1 Tax=Trichocoleus sp. FACHB-262 TaxID=2692869 RepID=UPI00168466EF|nr:DNA polymerase III subunit beta [Trichocoleus sp. FACHB-262]MBD2121546.1 DNA polymerase III subunit beta [Trichocoleus sp. FACHB-262]
MKLFCAQSDLSANLSLVSRAIPSRPTHPVLANVLLIADAAAQRVSLTAFDLSLGIRTSFAAHVETGGEITLPAKLLNDIVSRLPEGEINLADEAGNADASGEPSDVLQATLTCSSGRYQMRGLSAVEFPELPVIEDGEVVYLPVEALVQGLQGSLFATSADETKQILTGVHLTLQQGSLEFAATDGHRLAVVQTTGETPDAQAGAAIADTELTVTIPAKTLRELERMVGMRPAEDAVALHLNPSQAVFEWADQRLTSRLLEGQYPNYRQLIPRQFSRQMTVERRLFLGALERIAVLADQKNNVVKLSLDLEQQEIALSVDAQDVGNGREVIPAQVSSESGDSLDVAFNVKYLMDGLKALNTSEIQMQLNSATTPVVLTPLGSIKMTYLVMPVQIRS